MPLALGACVAALAYATARVVQFAFLPAVDPRTAAPPLRVQENLFQYNDGTGADVEGMGFGALHHFWIGNCGYGSGGVHKLYEIGGGDLDRYTAPAVK